MTQLSHILENSLLAQIHLEERIYKEIELQLSQPNLEHYADVKEMLGSVKVVLEKHYAQLNLALDRLTERQARRTVIEELSVDPSDPEPPPGTNNRIRRTQVSQQLQDNYAALTQAAMGNTLLYTTAVAAEAQDVADIALEHRTNLTNFVVALNDLAPKVVAQELALQFPQINRTIGELAAQKTQEAWKAPINGGNAKNTI